MILEKVYDELYGMIEDLQKKIGSGGGSTVTITPTLESGVKLADFSIDETDGAIYAPPVIEYYSTTPRVIGEWIDGSEVKRKVITGSVEATGGNISTGIPVGSSIIKFEATLTTGTGDIVAYGYNTGSASDRFITYLQHTDMSLNVSSGLGGSVIAIIDYVEPTTETKKTTKKK